MPQAVEPNVRPNPMDIIPLGSYAVVQIPDALAQLVEDLDRTQWRQVAGDDFHSPLILFFCTAKMLIHQAASRFRQNLVVDVMQQTSLDNTK